MKREKEEEKRKERGRGGRENEKDWEIGRERGRTRDQRVGERDFAINGLSTRLGRRNFSALLVIRQILGIFSFVGGQNVNLIR